MVAMARTPHASWDSTSNRFIINWRFPKAVQALTGTFFRDRFPRSLSPAQAAQRETDRRSEFYQIIATAQEQLGTTGGRLLAIRNTVEASLNRTARDLIEREDALDEAEAIFAAKKKQVQFHKMARELGVVLPTVERLPSSSFVDSEAVVQAWIVERRDVLKKPPKDDMIKRKRQVIRDMLAGTGTGRPHSGAVTEGDLRAYHGKLGSKAYDHLSELRPLFRRAKAVGLIEVNPFPAAIDKMPPKVRRKRSMFLDHEAGTILEAAHSAEPGIKWSNFLAAYTGTINSEIFEAHASEFYQDDAGQWVWDMRGRELKTAFRPRVLPLHPAIKEAGFLDYLATREGKPLFEGNPAWLSNKVNLWLKQFSTGSFYYWRHRVIHNLDKLIKVGKTTESLNQFIQGHTGSTIARRHYHHHELPSEFPEIVAAINAPP